MEKFITNNVWSEVNDLISNSNKKKMISIAYVTSNKLKLTEGDVLICDASEYSIKNGETSVKVLQTYLSQGVEIYSLEQLHSKFLVSEDFLVIGSANLSENSAENLIESAVITECKDLIKEAISFFKELKATSVSISIEKIKELSEIPVKGLNEQQRNFCKREKILASSISNVSDGVCEKYLLKILYADVIRENPEHVFLEIENSDIYESKTEKKHIYDKERISEWKDALSKSFYPKTYGKFKSVPVPKHIANNDKSQKISEELKVLVFCDKEGNFIENPYEVAMGKLDSVYYTRV